MTRGRALRIAGTLLVTGVGSAYLLWKIDVGETAHVIAEAHLAYLFASFAIMASSVLPMAWRWRMLLNARRISEPFPWLVRTYFVSYMVGQVLPTAIGGDASRIYETSRRHRGEGGPIAGSVLLERALGGAATLVLAAIGFVLAIGRYDVGAYLWVEAAFVVGTIVAAVVLFSRSVRRPLARVAPLLDRLRVGRPIRAVYEGIHGYRASPRLLFEVFALTLLVQAYRVLAIWCAGKAVGIGLPPRPYYVMGPMLFLVMLVPFTINGLAVRESFFVSFLGTLGVAADPAFACGFLFFLVTVMLAVPGALVLAWEGVRPAAVRARRA